MSLPVGPISVSYQGNATPAQPYEITFPFLNNQHIVLEVDGVAIDSANFTVTGEGEPDGGQLTTASTYTAEQTVVIKRITPRAQDFVFANLNLIPPAVLEKALDKLMMVCQENELSLSDAIAQLTNRVLKFPEDEPDAHSTTLDTALLRRDRVLYFDPSTGEQQTLRMDLLAQRLLVILGAEAVLPQRVLEITADYTLQAGDSNALLVFNSVSDLTLTFPETGEDIDDTFQVSLFKRGTGNVTFATEGTTVLAANGSKLFDTNEATAVHRIGSNLYAVYGNLTGEPL